MYKILVIEKEERLCTAITTFLQNRGMEPVVAPSVQRATQILDELDIDLVVLDIKLSDELVILRHLREFSDCADLPVIALSTWDIDPCSFDYLDPGDYLIKPFDIRMLDWMIEQLLEGGSERASSPFSPVLSSVQDEKDFSDHESRFDFDGLQR